MFPANRPTPYGASRGTGRPAMITNATVPARLQLGWRLPRQLPTVALARHLLDSALRMLGAAPDCRADLALALNEACANAVRHAQGTSMYQIAVTIDPRECVIEVVDRGVGLYHHRVNGSRPGADPPGPTFERGHGLWIMQNCTEALELLAARPGLRVRMRKAMTWKPAPAAVSVGP